MERHYTPKQACEILGISLRTLQEMDRRGKIQCIRTAGGRRRIPESEIQRLLGIERPKILVLYGRVSSHEQKKKGDLERQIESLEEHFSSSDYAEIKIITDVGSGLGEKRRGLRKLFQLAQERKISDIAVTYQDRLTRFGFSYLESFFEHCGVTLHVLNHNDKQTLEEELTQDLLAIITSFSGKLYGMRSHKARKVVKTVKEVLGNKDEK
ncbi:MAG: IS607 family transposase [bacterium]